MVLNCVARAKAYAAMDNGRLSGFGVVVCGCTLTPWTCPAAWLEKDLSNMIVFIDIVFFVCLFVCLLVKLVCWCQRCRRCRGRGAQVGGTHSWYPKHRGLIHAWQTSTPTNALMLT